MCVFLGDFAWVRILLRPLFHFAGFCRFAPPVLRANRKAAALRSARNTLDFPTFSGHTITLTNSPGRLELFEAEITKRTVRPFALTSLQQAQD